MGPRLEETTLFPRGCVGGGGGGGCLRTLLWGGFLGKKDLLRGFKKEILL